MIARALILFIVLNVSCKRNYIQDEESFPKKWETLLPVEIYYGSPALSKDENTLYIGTSSGLFGNHQPNQVFVAIDVESGKENWQLQLGMNEVRSSAAVASDNSIFFTVETRDPANGTIGIDELWHISSGGDLLWKYNINPGKLTIEVGQSSPAIGGDGTVYVAGDKLYAINPDGSLRWTIFGSTNEALRNAPVIGEDGTIYFVYHNIPLTAINPENGSVIWTCPLGVNDHCFASPAVGADGTIYVATQPGLVFAVSLIGMANTKSGITWSSPAIDSKGVLYISDLSGRIYAFQTGSMGLDPSAGWPKSRYDNINSGRLH